MSSDRKSLRVPKRFKDVTAKQTGTVIAVVAVKLALRAGKNRGRGASDPRQRGPNRGRARQRVS